MANNRLRNAYENFRRHMQKSTENGDLSTLTLKQLNDEIYNAKFKPKEFQMQLQCEIIKRLGVSSELVEQIRTNPSAYYLYGSIIPMEPANSNRIEISVPEGMLEYVYGLRHPTKTGSLDGALVSSFTVMDTKRLEYKDGFLQLTYKYMYNNTPDSELRYESMCYDSAGFVQSCYSADLGHTIKHCQVRRRSQEDPRIACVKNGDAVTYHVIGKDYREERDPYTAELYPNQYLYIHCSLANLSEGYSNPADIPQEELAKAFTSDMSLLHPDQRKYLQEKFPDLFPPEEIRGIE